MRFGRFDGESLAAVVLSWLDLPAPDRVRLGRAASARVAAALDWSVVTSRAVDFVEARTRAAAPVSRIA